MALTTLLSINVSPSPAATHKSSQRKNLLFLGMGHHLLFAVLFLSFWDDTLLDYSKPSAGRASKIHK